MTRYTPGAAAGARVRKEGETWTLILVRELHHAPENVWQALTDPAHLSEWAPFDADRNLSGVGPVRLSMVTTDQAVDTAVTRAEPPRLLEYNWGGGDLRWELEPIGSGTRLTLWHRIDRRYVAWGAASWHICLDVLERLLAGAPMGRMAGPAMLQSEGWQRLRREYAEQFGAEAAASQGRVSAGRPRAPNDD